MKVYIVGISCLVIIMGCNNQIIQKNSEAQVESYQEIVNENDNLEIQVDTKKVSKEKFDANKKEIIVIEECDYGYVYNTMLDKCFKLGESEIKDESVKSKIDPVVNECVEKRGVYNSQIEKCFVD